MINLNEYNLEQLIDYQLAQLKLLQFVFFDKAFRTVNGKPEDLSQVIHEMRLVEDTLDLLRELKIIRSRVNDISLSRGVEVNE